MRPLPRASSARSKCLCRLLGEDVRLLVASLDTVNSLSPPSISHWTGAESDAWDRLDGAHDEDDSDFEDVTDDADGTDEDGDSDGDSESSEMKTSFARFYVPLVSNTNTNEFESQPEIFDAELLSQLQCNINAALDELLGGKVTLKPLVPFTADTAALIDRFTEFLPRLEREMGLQLWCTEERGFDEEHVKDALEAIGLRAKAVEPYAATQKYQCMISDLFGMNENDEDSGDCSGEHDGDCAHEHAHAHEHARKQSHDHSHSGDCCSGGDHAEDEEEEDDLELFQVAFAQNPVDADGNITGDYAPIRMLQFVLFFPYSLDPLAAWKAIQLAVQHTRAIFQAQGYRMEERYIGLWEDAASAKKKRSMSKAVLMEKSLVAMIAAVGEFGFRLGDEAFQRLFE